ncbi:MAG: dihydrofolate reductase family protein [Gammaproteobacteria bacterium]
MKLVVSQYMSLDGVIEDPVGMEETGLGNWIGPFRHGPEGDVFKHQELMDAGAVLLGRRTYDGFAAVWPHVEEPTGYADRINSLPKYVASRSLQETSWNNSHILSGSVAKDVGNLKDQGGGDILVFGSATLVHDLLRNGLVDELSLMIYPVVLGRGLRLFPEGWSGTLARIDQRPLGDEIALLRYRVESV